MCLSEGQALAITALDSTYVQSTLLISEDNHESGMNRVSDGESVKEGTESQQ